jgi:carbonic anhydrase
MTNLRCAFAFGLQVSLALVAAASADGPSWTYDGHGGPAEWAELDPGFATCGLGKLQSPIDIRGAKAADLPAIRFEYRAEKPTIVDNGHTVQVNVAPGSAIEVGGERFELLQFHFHKPSEERIDGRRTTWSSISCTAHGGAIAVVCCSTRQRESASRRALAAPSEKDA